MIIRKRALRVGHFEFHEPLFPPLCNAADAQQSAFPCGVLPGRAPALFDWFPLNLTEVGPSSTGLRTTTEDRGV